MSLTESQFDLVFRRIVGFGVIDVMIIRKPGLPRL